MGTDFKKVGHLILGFWIFGFRELLRTFLGLQKKRLKSIFTRQLPVDLLRAPCLSSEGQKLITILGPCFRTFRFYGFNGLPNGPNSSRNYIEKADFPRFSLITLKFTQ